MLGSLLRSQRLWPLLACQVGGTLTDNIFKQAFVFIVIYALSLPSAKASQYNIMATALLVAPFLLFSSIAGELCDKQSKSKLIILTKISEFIILLLGIYAMFTAHVPLMLLVIFLFGTHSTFLSPLRLAVMPEYLKEFELITGNAVFEISTFACILMGEILANLLFTSETYGLVILSTALLFISGSSLIASFFLPPTTAKNPDLKVSLNPITTSIDIIKRTRHYRTIYLCILGISWFWLVSGMIIIEIPILMKNIINATPGVVTLAMVMFGVGISCGSSLCGWLLRTRIEATYVPLAAFGISFLLYDLASVIHALTPNDIPMTITMFLSSWTHLHLLLNFLLLGTFGGLYHVPLYTIMQHESPESIRARVMACHNIISTGFTLLGAGLNFLLAYLYDGNPAYTLAFISLMFAWISLYISQIMPYDILTTVFRWFFMFFYRGKIKGLDHYNACKHERCVIVSNHTSWLDAIILAAFLPEKLTFAFNPNMTSHWLIRHFIKLNKVFIIDPMQPMSVRGLIESVKEGEKVVIFPEGRISETGSLMKVYDFPVMIAERTGAKLLPIQIQGMEKTFFSRAFDRSLLRIHGKLRVHILPPVKLPSNEHKTKRDKRRTAGDFLYNIMTEMNYATNKKHETLFEGLLSAARQHGRSKKIFEDINRSALSYGQLITKSLVLSQALKKPLSAVSHVGLLMPSSIATVVSFFTLQQLAKVPVMLNFSHGPGQLLNCCQTGNLNIVITAHKVVKLVKLEDHIEALKQAGLQILYLEDVAKNIGMISKVLGFLSSFFPKFIHRRTTGLIDPESTALMLFTSGSEGFPKGVALSHHNLQSNVAQVISVMDVKSSDIIFSVLPLFHTFGIFAGLIAPVTIGLKVFLYPNPLHYRVINELIYDTNATVLFGTDYFLSLYAKYANPYDYYSLRHVLAGAEKLQESTIQYWSEKFGLRILAGYGLTEASPVVSINTPMHHKAGSVGRLLPKIEYQLQPVEGIEEGGQLLIRGPNIMKGYIRHETPGVIEPLPDGWHDTGDVVTVDEEGYVFIKDRMKRFAKIAGEMVSLTAVEQVMAEQFPEHVIAVIQTPSSKRGEEIILCSETKDLTRAEIQKAFKNRGISELWVPKRVLTLEIPRTPTGKVNYPELNKQLKEIN